MTNVVAYKVKLMNENLTIDEIRRVNVKGNKDCLNHLKEVLVVNFPMLKNKEFSITWVDNDGDVITVGNDEQLAIALAEMDKPVRKINVTIKKADLASKELHNEPKIHVASKIVDLTSKELHNEPKIHVATKITDLVSKESEKFQNETKINVATKAADLTSKELHNEPKINVATKKADLANKESKELHNESPHKKVTFNIGDLPSKESKELHNESPQKKVTFNIADLPSKESKVLHNVDTRNECTSKGHTPQPVIKKESPRSWDVYKGGPYSRLNYMRPTTWPVRSMTARASWPSWSHCRTRIAPELKRKRLADQHKDQQKRLKTEDKKETKVDEDRKPKDDEDRKPKVDEDRKPNVDEDRKPKVDEDRKPKVVEDRKPKVVQDRKPKVDEKMYSTSAKNNWEPFNKKDSAKTANNTQVIKRETNDTRKKKQVMGHLIKMEVMNDDIQASQPFTTKKVIGLKKIAEILTY